MQTRIKTARVKRDLARQKHSREAECLGENSRLVCNTELGHGVLVKFTERFVEGKLVGR
jgi:hypothetical protein